MGIEWRDWGEEAFAQARKIGRPVLVSLTATWCHACHRMDDETWDDPAVAAVVMRETVPMRVDADARPDVYGRYHLGGLPSTALLTADGDFIRGGTFLSRPQFFAFLESGLADWKAGRRPRRRPPTVQAAASKLVDDVIARLVRRADLEHGGFGSAPKLAEVEALILLMGRWRANHDVGLERILRVSLDAIIDHLWDARDGGFFRYAAAADWSGPHTEKVAVDQARIARLLTEAGSALREGRYIEIGCEALAYVQQQLADHEGGVFASIAADPEYYAGAKGIADPPPLDRRRFADASAAMTAAAWFGLAVTDKPVTVRSEYRDASPDGAIPHRLDGKDGARVRGLLRDQALGIESTLMEYRLTGDPALLAWAERAARWSISHLWDEAAGAFRMAPAETDGASGLPPIFPLLANGEMAQALVALHTHTGHAEFRPYAVRVVETLGPQALASPAGPAIALAAQALEDAPAEAEITGNPSDPHARELARTIVAAMGPTTVIRWKPGAEAAATVCVRDRCLPPIKAPRDLLQALVHAGLAPGGILDPRSGADRKPY
jgi:uncharacterized protein YyaL (SSP411 family)